eukprot:11667790-Alexandrium_andersonii.AAC.1
MAKRTRATRSVEEAAGAMSGESTPGAIAGHGPPAAKGGCRGQSSVQRPPSRAPVPGGPLGQPSARARRRRASWMTRAGQIRSCG